jgi:rubrerythrin
MLQRLRRYGPFVRLIDIGEAARHVNPSRVNDGALLDLKTPRDATTHARRCPRCNYRLYRAERHCPLCGKERTFFRW